MVHTLYGDHLIHCRSDAATFRKLVFEPAGDRLVGAVLVGDIRNAGPYRYVIPEKMALIGFKRQIIGHTLHYGHFMR